MNKKILNPEKVWFIADTHFGHKNILKYDNRPFSNINEHDEVLINNWNKRVNEYDIVFHLGDFGFGSPKMLFNILTRLKGIIILIKGNHDKIIINNKKLWNQFRDIIDITRIAVEDQNEPLKRQSIVLCHYPIDDWDGKFRGSWHLHGHIHQMNILSKKTKDGFLKRFNVSVINTNYAPINYKELKDIQFNNKMLDLNKLKDIYHGN